VIARAAFGPDFVFGVATSAYQVEGGHDVDGRGPSIWDTFVRERGRIKDGSSGEVACDFYRRYAADLDLVRELNIDHIRWSVSWSRLIPDGTGPSNPAGADYYDKLTDACLHRGITPWVTLYHWDLPDALQRRGGWANRDVLGWFSDYAARVFDVLGDRVRHWMVLNEPMSFVGHGYLTGRHAPGRRSPVAFLRAACHATLCQAEVGRLLRSASSANVVGTTISAAWFAPWTEGEADRRATERFDAFYNRLFLEPTLGLGFPTRILPALRWLERCLRPGDVERLPFSFDFIGLQAYFRERVGNCRLVPFLRARIVPVRRRGLPPEKVTEMGWEVHPEALYLLLRKLAGYTGIRKIIVTENGAAFPDRVESGRVRDRLRQRYLEEHLAQVLRARAEGVPVEGYFVWTLLDNFEWAEGYRPRFGLVWTDQGTQCRTIKDSGFWYRDFLGG